MKGTANVSLSIGCLAEVPVTLPSGDDLLITRASGAIERVGVTCIDRDVPERYFLSDKTLRIRVDREAGDIRFVRHMLGSAGARTQIVELATGSHMRNLAQSRIREIKLPWPDLATQTALADMFEAFCDAAEAA